jgi:hypothetical protein
MVVQHSARQNERTVLSKRHILPYVVLCMVFSAKRDLSDNNRQAGSQDTPGLHTHHWLEPFQDCGDDIMKVSMKEIFSGDKDTARHDDAARIMDKEPKPNHIQDGLTGAFLDMGCGSVAQRFVIKNIFGVDNNKYPKRLQQRSRWGH